MNMKYIASCSFGKDSLAAIIARIEHGEPVDGAVYCRIMFDDETSAEMPEHEEWIHNHAIPLLKSRYGIETMIVSSELTYVDHFYKKFKRGKRVGTTYGFPYLMGPWCIRWLKTIPIEKAVRQMGEHVGIVGIAADEHKRIEGKMIENKILPLVDYGITEKEAFEICIQADLLSPAYTSDRTRLGCWFCHNQRVADLRNLRHKHPNLWQKLLELDNDSPTTFKPELTLRYFDETFAFEERQLSFFNDNELV